MQSIQDDNIDLINLSVRLSSRWGGNGVNGVDAGIFFQPAASFTLEYMKIWNSIQVIIYRLGRTEKGEWGPKLGNKMKGVIER